MGQIFDLRRICNDLQSACPGFMPTHYQLTHCFRGRRVNTPIARNTAATTQCVTMRETGAATRQPFSAKSANPAAIIRYHQPNSRVRNSFLFLSLGQISACARVLDLRYYLQFSKSCDLRWQPCEQVARSLLVRAYCRVFLHFDDTPELGEISSERKRNCEMV